MNESEAGGPESRTADVGRRRRSAIQKGALLVGAAYLLIGILGFVPGITQPYAKLTFASDSSTAKLAGLFQVSALHNIVHLLFGLAGLLLAATPLRARNYLLYGGGFYVVLFLYGILVQHTPSANVLPVNGADNVLHLVLGFGMIALGIFLDRGPGWRRTIETTRTVV